jgi:hypothetical protein
MHLEGRQMDQEELERLAGRQALLQRDRRAAMTAFTAEKQKIIGISNAAGSGVTQEWLNNGIKVLTRVFELQNELQELDRKIDELRKLTGLD